MARHGTEPRTSQPRGEGPYGMTQWYPSRPRNKSGSVPSRDSRRAAAGPWCGYRRGRYLSLLVRWTIGGWHRSCLAGAGPL